MRISLTFLFVLCLTTSPCGAETTINSGEHPTKLPETSQPNQAHPRSVSIFPLEVGTAAQWAAFLVASFNLLLVVVVFVWSVQDRVTRSRRDARNFWIQTLILSPNRQLLSDFFSKWTLTLAGIESDKACTTDMQTLTEARKSIFLEFKESVQSIRAEIVEPLSAISTEFDSLDPLINDIQDLLSSALQSAPKLAIESSHVADKVPASAMMRKYKGEFLRLLWVAQSKAADLDR